MVDIYRLSNGNFYVHSLKDKVLVDTDADLRILPIANGQYSATSSFLQAALKF